MRRARKNDRLKNEQMLFWDELEKINVSFSELIQKLHEDLALVERLQKSKLPKRFPSVKGFKASSRYLAGLRSGGDFFDLAESKDGNYLSLILSHSTSYGLSSAVLSVLMRVAAKLSLDRLAQDGGLLDTVDQIYDDLILTLGERDHLSLIFGVYSRPDQVLRLVHLGDSQIFYAEPGKGFQEISNQGGVISGKTGIKVEKEIRVQLAPEGRLVLLSGGFSEIFENRRQTIKILNQFRNDESVDSLNELVFHVKGKLSHLDEIPPRDCTGVVLEVDSRTLHMIKRGQDES